ncbi:MAG: EF-P beta-lysylation protein EpmB [Gammaproteobacteria bacterium]
MYTWQSQLKNCITDPLELCRLLELSPQQVPELMTHLNSFSLKVPHSFVARMQKGNPQDPLLRQVLPIIAETLTVPGYINDPLQENHTNKLPGLLHKYQGRVLLLVAGGCAVHCRYCFRRNFPYDNNVMNLSNWQPVLDYIAADPTITEVIYSGGDPLLAKDKILAQLTQQIAAIPHVQRLRIHTRLPVMIPERITDELLAGLTETRLQPVMVLHCNHAQEINESLKKAVEEMRQAGMLVLNQSVLLKSVNDSVAAIVSLSETLFAAGILPYYLHVLDAVAGAAHFAVSHAEASDLIHQASLQLSGYLVPKLVQEVPGHGAKKPVTPSTVPQ